MTDDDDHFKLYYINMMCGIFYHPYFVVVFPFGGWFRVLQY